MRQFQIAFIVLFTQTAITNAELSAYAKPINERQNSMQSTSTRNFYLPTDEEDVAINTGIAADPDTYE